MTETLDTNYEAIGRGAFEKYLLELVRGFAKEQERVYKEVQGEEMPILIQEVELSGSYPDTVLRLRRINRNGTDEKWHTESFWTNPLFFDEKGKRKTSASGMATDTLMWARGG